jgi:N-acetylmuramoyl-L-alanine amidase
MRVSFLARTVGLLVLLSGPNAWAQEDQEAEAAYQKARSAYYAFKEDPKRLKYRHHWQKIGTMFEKFIEKHPAAPRVPDALFSVGRLYRDLYKFSRQTKDLDHSQELLQQVVEKYPSSHLADDAQLYIALCYVEFRKDPEKAQTELKTLVERFPEGDVTPKARRMLEDLGGPEADSEPPAVPPKEQPVGVVKAENSRASKEGKPEPAETEDKKEPPLVPVERSVLENIRHWSDPGYTRISLYTRSQTSYKVGILPADAQSGQPPRLYVDLKNVDLDSDVSDSMLVGDGVVKRIRVAAREGGFVRVVIDLDKEREHRVFPMEDPARVVVDIGGGDKGENSPAIPQDVVEIQAATGAEQKPDETKRATKEPPKSSVEEYSVPDSSVAKQVQKKIKALKSRPGASLSMLAGLKVKRIVLDPGHGGNDPGAIGPNGTLEKELTLDLAHRIAKLLKDEQGLEVLFTRTTDTTLALEERTAIANTNKADLFVSIHLNANRDRRLKGVETFYLDISDDRYSMRLAARENATSEKSISDLQYILADLALKSHVDDSISLSRHVQRSIVGALRKTYKDIKDLGVKYALFYVLIGARMPSILVEASFISNPEEEKRLCKQAYKDELAQAISLGIKGFISERTAKE